MATLFCTPSFLHLRMYLNFRHLANGGGEFGTSSVRRSRLRSSRRNLLIPFLLFVLTASLASLSLLSCSKDDGPAADPSDPATRALTHEDSVRLGLILTADSAWDGIIDEHF